MLNHATRRLQRLSMTASPFNVWHGKLALAAALLLVVIVIALSTRAQSGRATTPDTPALATPSAAARDGAQDAEPSVYKPTLLASEALAATDAPAAPATDTPLASTALTVMASLGAVIVIIYGTIRALRHFVGPQVEGRALLRAQDKLVSVREVTPLSPKHALYVVRAGDRLLLLGATDQQVSCLAELGEAATPPPAPATFAGALAQLEKAETTMPPAPAVTALLHKARSKVTSLKAEQAAGAVQSFEHRI